MNLYAALRQRVENTPWYAKRKSYRVLFWREITLAVPIFLENACVLLMGVLSTFLVSWLGKEAMAGVGLADSFNMVIIAFFAAVDPAPPWWWPSASASAIVGARARRVSPRS